LNSFSRGIQRCTNFLYPSSATCRQVASSAGIFAKIVNIKPALGRMSAARRARRVVRSRGAQTRDKMYAVLHECAGVGNVACGPCQNCAISVLEIAPISTVRRPAHAPLPRRLSRLHAPIVAHARAGMHGRRAGAVLCGWRACRARKLGRTLCALAGSTSHSHSSDATPSRVAAAASRKRVLDTNTVYIHMY
jgi:hypothetical protein